MSFDHCCHPEFAHIRFNQLWRQHVHHDKHGTARRKSTKCEAPYLFVHLVCVCVCALVCVMAPTLVKNNCSAFLYCIFVHPLQFPMGAGGDGPLGGMAGMEPHHINGSLGTVTSVQAHCILSQFRWFIQQKCTLFDIFSVSQGQAIWIASPRSGKSDGLEFVDLFC